DETAVPIVVLVRAREDVVIVPVDFHAVLAHRPARAVTAPVRERALAARVGRDFARSLRAAHVGDDGTVHRATQKKRRADPEPHSTRRYTFSFRVARPSATSLSRWACRLSAAIGQMCGGVSSYASGKMSAALRSPFFI